MGTLAFVAFWWIVFCVLHSLLVHDAVKATLKGWMGIDNQTYRLVYALISIILLFASTLITLISDGTFLKKPDAITYTGGSLLMLGGLYLMRECFKNYHLIEFLGLKAEGKPNLQLGGLNRYVRHPLYLSTLIFLLGILVFWPTDVFAVSILIIGIYTVIGSKIEEKKLIATFGKAYTDYMVEVPALLPRLKNQ